jgi:hypothetical protein
LALLQTILALKGVASPTDHLTSLSALHWQQFIYHDCIIKHK